MAAENGALFRPINIGQLTLPGRLFKTATAETRATPDGFATQEVVEGTQHHYPFANEKTVARSTNSGTTARTKLEQPVTKSARVRQPEVWPVFSEEFDQMSVVGASTGHDSIYKHALVEVLDLEGDRAMLANTLTTSQSAQPPSLGRRRLRMRWY